VVLGLIVAAASIYLIYVLEILKFNRGGGRSAESVTLEAEGPSASVPDAVQEDDGAARGDDARSSAMGGPAHESVAGWSGGASDRDPQAR
jgi:hypothetical protein